MALRSELIDTDALENWQVGCRSQILYTTFRMSKLCTNVLEGFIDLDFGCSLESSTANFLHVQARLKTRVVGMIT